MFVGPTLLQGRVKAFNRDECMRHLMSIALTVKLSIYVYD